jgi:hypothetical protein
LRLKGSIVDIRLGSRGTAQGVVKSVDNERNVADVELDLSGATQTFRLTQLTIAHEYFQKLAVGLRVRSPSEFVAERGVLTFPENLETHQSEVSGIPFACIHTSDMGYSGFGKMGDVVASEMTMVYTEFPVKHSASSVTAIRVGDLAYFPSFSGHVKTTKTYKSCPTTADLAGDTIYEVWGRPIAVSERSDKLVNDSTELILVAVGQYGRPRQFNWFDYSKGSKRLPDGEYPQLIFVDIAQCSEDGFYHLSMTAALREKFWGYDFQAQHVKHLTQSALLKDAKAVGMLGSKGLGLISTNSTFDAAAIAELMVYGFLSRAAANVEDMYARVGGLNKDSMAQATQKYLDAVGRAIKIISNTLGVKRELVKRLTDAVASDLAPRLTARASERSQAASGTSMASTKLPSSAPAAAPRSRVPAGPGTTADKKAPPKATPPAPSEPPPAPSRAVRKSSLEIPGSEKKEPPPEEVRTKKVRALGGFDIPKDASGRDLLADRPVKGLSDTISLPAVRRQNHSTPSNPFRGGGAAEHTHPACAPAQHGGTISPPGPSCGRRWARRCSRRSRRRQRHRRRKARLRCRRSQP